MNDFIVSINDKSKKVQIIDDKNLIANGVNYSYDFYPLNNDSYILRLNEKFHEVKIKNNGEKYYNILINNSIFETIVRNKLQDEAAKIIEQKKSGKHTKEIKAPMPGMVIVIKKNVGDAVVKNDSVIILEAMKMENDIRTSIEGHIKDIYVKAGTAVEKGALLFSIE